MKRADFFKALLALPFVPGVLAKLKPGYAAELSYGNRDDLLRAIFHPRIRYGLCPGWVWDGRGRYVSAPELAKLYGVPLDECMTFKTEPVDRSFPEAMHCAFPYEGNEVGLIMLRPRADGDYRIPVVTSEEVRRGVSMGILRPWRG